jgi:transcriptional regulator
MKKVERIELIKIGMLKKGVTFVDLAKEMNCTRQNISNIARGIYKLDKKKVKKSENGLLK